MRKASQKSGKSKPSLKTLIHNSNSCALDVKSQNFYKQVIKQNFICLNLQIGFFEGRIPAQQKY